jgi:hypothetical protein
MRQIFAFLVLCFAVSITRSEPRLCNVEQLPAQIQNRLATDFSNWKVQTPENLSHQARLSWEDRKSLGCPGIARGFFNGPQKISYALLLVPSEDPDAAYRFVVFQRQQSSSAYDELIVEKSDDRGASNFSIQRVPISKFFDGASVKKFQVHANEAILVVDSAENEYGADVYFWSNDKFRREPVDY